MLLEFPEICFEDIRAGMTKTWEIWSTDSTCSAIIVSTQSKSGTGGAINVASEDDDDGSVDPDFVSLILYSILNFIQTTTDRLVFMLKNAACELQVVHNMCIC